MSLQAQIQSFVVRVADEFKAVYNKIGTLASLSTATKANLVAAINEVKAGIGAAATIDDAQSGSTTTTFSASKITTLLDTQRADLLGGADPAFDTLLELQQAIQTDQTGVAAITAALDKRVRFDAAQTLTVIEQTQARDNIGAVSAADVGDTTVNFVAIFEAALVA